MTKSIKMVAITTFEIREKCFETSRVRKKISLKSYIIELISIKNCF